MCPPLGSTSAPPHGPTDPTLPKKEGQLEGRVADGLGSAHRTAVLFETWIAFETDLLRWREEVEDPRAGILETGQRTSNSRRQ